MSEQWNGRAKVVVALIVASIVWGCGIGNQTVDGSHGSHVASDESSLRLHEISYNDEQEFKIITYEGRLRFEKTVSADNEAWQSVNNIIQGLIPLRWRWSINSYAPGVLVYVDGIRINFVMGGAVVYDSKRGSAQYFIYGELTEAAQRLGELARSGAR